MSALKAFLQPPVAGVSKEIIISDRFRGEDGEPAPFVIQAISQEENEAIVNRSKSDRTVKGVTVEKLDNTVYTRRLMKACVKSPDLSDSELCRYYGTMDPEEVLGKMLSVGEYQALGEEILKINGMGAREEKRKEAKNS